MSILRCSCGVLLLLSGCSLPHAPLLGLDASGAETSTDVAVDHMMSDIASSDAMDASDAGSDDAADVLDASDGDAVMDAPDAPDALDASNEAAADVQDVLDVQDVQDVLDASDAGMDARDAASDGNEAGEASVDAGRDAGCAAGTVDCGDGTCRSIRGTVATCAAATENGLHVLTVGGTNFCATCQDFGGGARWTMVLKVDGRNPAGSNPQRFAYDSALWTNDVTYNEYDVERDLREMKSRGFSAHPLREILVEMNTGGTVRVVRGTLANMGSGSIASLRALFSGGNNSNPNNAFSTSGWLDSVPDGQLQDRCRRAGVNVRANDGDAARVRLGAIGNENLINDCDSHDSWVGVGGSSDDNNNDQTYSAGNIARWNGIGGDRTTRTHATIWVRE